MANPEHVKVVLEGKEAIAQWQALHPKERLNLLEADLSGADLNGADLYQANMMKANLSGANLTGADLFEADLHEANMSRADLSGSNLLGADLFEAKLVECKLTGADLSRSHFTSADLSGAKLTEAKLTLADLSLANVSAAQLNNASLFAANLTQANLTNANLIGADLFSANLARAKLMGASLAKANLTAAIFAGAGLSGADLSRAICGFTLFANCNLADCRGLESVVHEGPSTIGIDTLIASFRGAGNRLTPELETFFRGAGVPKELLDELPRIVAEVRYYSCFIAYGEPDRAFAERLRNDLVTRGVSCWFYPKDATPGERTWREVGQERQKAEKMIVLCSAQGLVKEGIRKEIEEQIDEDPDKMVPVSLDDLWREPGFLVMRGNRDLKPFLLPDRNYADFTGPYEEALERLLKGLERKPQRRPGPKKAKR